MKVGQAYATITLELRKSGMIASCDEINEEVFIESGDGNALMDFINLVDDCTNPDATYTLTDKGRELLEEE